VGRRRAFIEFFSALLRYLWIQSGVGWTWVLRLRESFPGGSDGKESACNAGDTGLIPRLDLFALQETFRSLLQHHSSKALLKIMMAERTK